MGTRIGIYGGGQLGLYLCRAARDLGLFTTVVTPDPESPACAVADRVLSGALDDLALAARLVAEVDVVTFEIEAIPAPVLDYLEQAEARRQVLVAPRPATLRLLQNKARQKAWLAAHGMPSAPFRTCAGGLDEACKAARGLGLPVVQKLQHGGYDGRGVQVLRSAADLARLWPEPSLVESYLPGVRELAVLVARARDGSLRSYAPVSLQFNAGQNVLETVIAPAAVAPETVARAATLATRAIDRLGSPGLFAVELFLRVDGTLLVNEISPRVHNAGHHTLEACPTSQFEQHLRAVVGLPLGETQPTRQAVMHNLLWTPELERTGAPSAHGDGEFVHWYGKREPRPWRKMGHVTRLLGGAPARRGREVAA